MAVFSTSGTKFASSVSATFDISNNKHAAKWLSQHDLINEEHECILRRIVSAEGRSKAYINGSQVPLTQLKEIGGLLINIHGQQDHQLIMKNTEQRKMLDGYANHSHLLNDVQYYFHKVRYRHLIINNRHSYYLKLPSMN